MPMGIGLRLAIDNGDGVSGFNGADLALWFDTNQAYKSSGGGIVTPDSILTYTAPSPKLVYGSGGVLGYAPHNLLLRSEEFDNAAWTKDDGSVTANDTTAPDGTTTADKYVPNTTTIQSHRVRQAFTLSAISYAYSVYIKAAGYTWVKFRLNSLWGNVNLSTGAIGFTSGATMSAVDVGDGWWRITLLGTPAAASSFAYVYPLATDGNSIDPTAWAGNGTSGILIWGAQLNLGPTALTYIPTTTAAVYSLPRDYNPTTGAALGVLVEGARTNLLLWSEQFNDAAWTKIRATVTANAVTAPDGTVTSDTLSEDGNAGTSHIATQSVSYTSGVTYTFSIFVKKANRNWFIYQLPGTAFGGTSAERTVSFNVNTGVVGTAGATFTASSIQSVGNGWYRCIATATANATASSILQVIIGEADGDFTFDGLSQASLYLWGAQLEAGAFATSYIPTVASQVTRAADQISILTSAFPYSATAGTITLVARPILANSLGASASLNDGTGNEEIVLYRDASGNIVYQVEDGGANQLDPLDSGQNAANLTEYKMAAAWAANDFATAVGGNAAVTDTSGTLPTVTTLEVGVNQANNYNNGHIKRLDYYAVRKTNAELQVLST